MRSTLSRATRPRPADAEVIISIGIDSCRLPARYLQRPEIQMIVLEQQRFPSGDTPKLKRRPPMVALRHAALSLQPDHQHQLVLPAESRTRRVARRQVTTPGFGRVHPDSGEIPIVAFSAGR